MQIDPELSENDLDGILSEIDQDGSGTVDFEGMRTFSLFKFMILIRRCAYGKVSYPICHFKYFIG